MHPDLQKAKALLEGSADTCVLCKGTQIHRSDRRGVAPLMDFWERKVDLQGFCAADKVVGKATALLYCLLQVDGVYAHVMSRPALQVLRSHNIHCYYTQLVEAIQNRTGTGFCPMETATMHIDDPQLAPQAIKEALKNL